MHKPTFTAFVAVMMLDLNVFCMLMERRSSVSIRVPLLSMKMTEGSCSRCRPCKTFCIQTASSVACAAAMYSASVEEVAVVACFFLVQILD
jgi:hypothetical protein